jgi:ABC-type transport system involved in multi-copper enzyme maturation permease subunit
MRGRLGRYSLYQLRDYVVERGLPTVLIGTILFLPLIFALVRPIEPESIPESLLLASLGALLPIFAFISVLLGINGIVSNDRQRGYFRFLFSKPISVRRYYLQAFLINGVGTLASTGFLVLMLALLAGAAFPLWVMQYIALYYVAAGGVGFLLSVLTRFDWIALGIVWLLAQTLRGLAMQLGGWYYDVLDVVLPPAHLMAQLAGDLGQGVAVPSRTLLWVAGYGVLGLLLGVLALRRRPLAT